jgi:hypothetical protein
MYKSYIGVADSHGLRSFLPERFADVDRLLTRVNAYRESQSVCLWAVVSDDDAKSIWSDLSNRSRHESLILLESVARELVVVRCAR